MMSNRANPLCASIVGEKGGYAEHLYANQSFDNLFNPNEMQPDHSRNHSNSTVHSRSYSQSSLTFTNDDYDIDQIDNIEGSLSRFSYPNSPERIHSPPMHTHIPNVSQSQSQMNDNDSNHLQLPNLPSSHCYPTPQSSFESMASPKQLTLLYLWLKDHGLSVIYAKLIEAGYDSIELFDDCDSDDIKQIAKTIHLTHAQTLRLRKAVKTMKKANAKKNMHRRNDNISNINNNNNNANPRYELERDLNVNLINNNKQRSNSMGIITEQEKEAMISISEYINDLTKFRGLLLSKHSELDKEYKAKENEICSKFSSIFNALHERKMNLINDLNFVYQIKKDNLENGNDKIDKLIENAKLKQKQCSQLILSQALDDCNLHDRMNVLSQTEQQIVNHKNECLKCIEPIDINVDIAIDFNHNNVIQNMSSWGEVKSPRASHECLQYYPKQEEIIENNEAIEEKKMEHTHHKIKKKHKKDRSNNVLLNKSPQIGGRNLVIECDEWISGGDNLVIDPDRHSLSNKILNIGRIINHSSGYRGCGYSGKVVSDGMNFWKLKINYKHDYNHYNLSFAIGFVPSKYGTVKRNTWFLSHEQSIGIYSDSQMCYSGHISKDVGIEMRNKDIINICLDMNKGHVYIQRCEFNKKKKNRKQRSRSFKLSNMMPPPSSPIVDYIVHRPKCIKKGINTDESYRLACYLREKAQSITILEFSKQPFDEWMQRN